MGQVLQVLVTGASGRLGKMLQLAWAQHSLLGFDPIWCDRRAANPAFVHWDILSNDAPALPEGAVILHLAGVLRGDAGALCDNAAMALRVCDVAKAAGARHVFLASSAAVYGRGLGDLKEDQTPNPVSDYGHAKLDMERQVRRWSQNAGAQAPGVTCLRLGNIVGADQLIGQSVAGRPIQLDAVPGQNGGPMRSYIGPGALAFVLAKLICKAGRGDRLPRILNVASAQPVFMADLLAAAGLPFYFGAENSQVIARVVLSTARLAKLVPVNAHNPAEMIADWQNLMAAAS